MFHLTFIIEHSCAYEQNINNFETVCRFSPTKLNSFIITKTFSIQSSIFHNYTKYMALLTPSSTLLLMSLFSLSVRSPRELPELEPVSYWPGVRVSGRRTIHTDKRVS